MSAPSQTDAPVSNADMIALCINSNVNRDETPLLDHGHAWITLHENASTEGYGLWADGVMSGALQGTRNTDVLKNEEDDGSLGAYHYCEEITEAQRDQFEKARKEPAYWWPTHNCSSWASNTFHDVTGVDVDADDEWFMGVESPQELGQNITRLNEQRALEATQ
jgi:hypothetical protein